MKQRARHYFSATWFSSVNNYNAQQINESVYKVAEEAWIKETRKKIEEEVMAKLTDQFSSEWAQKEAVLKKEMVVEKTALKRTGKKV